MNGVLFSTGASYRIISWDYVISLGYVGLKGDIDSVGHGDLGDISSSLGHETWVT